MAVIVVPTKKCDLRCRHCLRDTFASGYLDVDLLSKFIGDVLKKSNNRKWCMTGGEPTVHPKIDELLKVYASYGIKTNIVTNGQRPEGYQKVINVKEAIDYINVSFDSPNEDQNDLTRGAGSYKAAIEAVKAYLDAGVTVHISFVLHDDNKHLINECFKFGKSLGVHKVSIWAMQRWVSNTSSGGAKYKSMHTDEDLTYTDGVGIAIYNHGMFNYASKYHPMECSISNKFSQHYDGPHLLYTHCVNLPTRTVPAVERIVLLPDGKVSNCCDLYDVDYNQHKFEPTDEEPLDHILGDYTTESLDVILERKIQVFEVLKQRRERDSKAGLLVGDRANVCTNCAYYHYQKPKGSKVIEIKPE